MKTTTSVLKKAVMFFAVFLFMENQGKAQHQDNMKKKILFVVTSHDKKGETGEPTGFYLSEVSHPWEILANAGYEIDFVSPKGGKAPVDGFNLSDETNRKFWEDERYKSKIENTLKPSQINPNDYIAIHYAGGHGAMWDFADNKQLANIAAKIYENGGIVSAVCHGPAGLVNIKLSNGKYLVDGKKINAFTNEEEVAVKLDKVVPFLLESKLIERGAIFEKSGLWQARAVADKRVVTGQNPQSAKMVGENVLQQLGNLDMVAKMTQFEVKTTEEQNFRKAISEYVQSALSRDGNVMAEAYYEKDKPSVLWLIERWKNKNEYADFAKSTEAKALKALQKRAVSKNYDLSDLEPLSKSQWRKVTAKTDEQLTIMLFVDAKKGTEQNFKDTYHVAMPQFRSEPGVVTYQLSQVEGDGTLFVTFEKFRSQAAFQYHLDFPPIKPVIEYLEASIKKPPFQNGLHTLVEFAPLTRE